VANGETHGAGAATWSLQLPQFEGPLDLLLHLCQKHELNVLEIPIAFVTQKYLEYLAVMQLMNLELAAEYLVMAATLAHIKSKLLVPASAADPDDDDADEEEGDPRAALIRRLLEYQKYKAAAEQLGTRGVAGRDVFGRGMALREESGAAASLAPLAEIPLYSLLEAFQGVLDRSRVKLSHDVVADRVSITDRITELSDLLGKHGRISFESLFQGMTTRFDLVITFLALLEMTRLRMTHLVQAEPLGPLYIDLAVPKSNENAAESSS
jgi:segregation and condensation protein A